MFIIITSPHFVAAYDTRNGYIAPIIHYMKGWSPKQIFQYCEKKSWTYAATNLW